MTRAQMRARLERRLQDSSDETWDDAAKNELLNDGLRKVQERIMHINPYFLIYVDRADIVAGEKRTKKPVGLIYEFKLERKDPTSGLYTRMKRRSDQEAETYPKTLVYSLDGQYFKLSETPSASLANGLQVTWMPTMSMAADSDVPDIHINLHIAIVVASQLIALGDTGVARDSVAAELEWHASPEVIGRYYQLSAADLEQLEIEYGKVSY